MTFIRPAPYLRQGLLADATTSGAFGLLTLLAAAPLEGVLGLPAMLVRSAGLIMIPWALCLGRLAMRESLPRPAVLAVIVVNALWALDSLLLLWSGWVAPSSAGTVFVIAQALVVALYAELQFVGLKRSTAATA
jgi:hypothetical protein